MNNSSIYLIHGFTASSRSNWFPWLREELHKKAIEITIPDMPDTNDPHLLPWIDKIDDVAKVVDENTIFIGHSLGCISVLRYVLQKNIKIRGAILVSGFIYENPMEIQTKGLSEFVEDTIDVERLKVLIPNRVAVSATDDDIVPWEATKDMADQLDARLILLSSGKHFIERDGFTEFPEVLEILEGL